MSQLIKLRQHIRSIQTTKKMTYAMRLISRSLYAKLERSSKSLENHQNYITVLFKALRSHTPDWEHPTILPKDILNSHPLIIIAASTKGLCGSFNTNLYRYFNRYFYLEEHQTPAFISIGLKATELLYELKLGTIIKSYDNFNSNNYLTIAQSITQHIYKTETPYSSVIFFSNQFKNFFIQKPIKNILIPLSIDENKTYANQSELFQKNTDLIWEQNQNVVLDHLAQMHLQATINLLLFQSLIAEYSSRFMAMDNATTNADRILESLQLKYYKSRQALITREVSELAATLE